MRSVRSVSRQLFVSFVVLSSKNLAGCNPITNSDLNDRIREFSSKNDSINTTGVKTLQKEESGRYADFSPVSNPVRFKDVSDSALSSSSYSRGLLHHDHPGRYDVINTNVKRNVNGPSSPPCYSLHEYEESPYSYGYEYHPHGSGHDHHVPDHHHHHHGHDGGHHDLSYHHKHYDHALAAKAFLWPIAGIAILGAAAALVTNPVLLQLGVISGRRKRRDTEEVFDTKTDPELSWLKKTDEEQFQDDLTINSGLMKKSGKKQTDEISFTYNGYSHGQKLKLRDMKNNSMKQEALFKILQAYPTVQSPAEVAVDNPRRFYSGLDLNKNKLIPVPLILKERP